MSLYVIEGTWEEIERRKAELIGRHLRVTITPERPALHKQSAQPKKLAAATQPKVLTGFGAFKGKIGSSEEFARKKKADIEGRNVILELCPRCWRDGSLHRR